MGGKRLSTIGKVLRRAEGRIGEWRRRDRARKAEAEADRDRLWAEAKEREKLLTEAAGGERSRRGSVEAVTERLRGVFVVHSHEEGRTLETFASEGNRLMKVEPVETGSEGDPGIKGPWLVFEASQGKWPPPTSGSGRRRWGERALPATRGRRRGDGPASGHGSPRKEFSRMNRTNGFPNKLLLATDGSEDAALAARAAIDLSGETGAELHVVHAWQSVPSARFESFIRAQLEQEAEELLAEQEKLVEVGGGDIAGTYLRRGPTVDEILDLAGELGVGMIVVGSRGMVPVKRLVMGSVSEGVVHHARCPVLVLRGGQAAWPPSRAVIGDDGSDDAGKAALLAARIGKPFGTNALLLRAYPRLPETDPEGRELDPRMVDDELGREQGALRARATETEGASGIRPGVRIAVGDPAACLIEAAEEAAPERTLIAVGSRGLGAVQRLRLGSVSTKVLRAAKGPVLVIHRGPRETRGQS